MEIKPNPIMKKCLSPSLKNIFCIFTISLLISVKSESQGLFQAGNVTMEAGINLGSSFFLGDLGGNSGVGKRFIKDINLRFTNIMKGGSLTLYPAPWLGLRGALQTGRLESSDASIEASGGIEIWRKKRNLDFRSNISEAYIGLEFFPLMFFKAMAESEPRLRPYGVVGIGMFRFNPQGSLTDDKGKKTWYDLHPLRTEGQGMAEYPDRKEYSLTQYNIPFGAGIKYYITDKFNIGTEVLYRRSFTDYIDDVSTDYIDPNLFDKYLSATDAIIAKQIYAKATEVTGPNAYSVAPGSKRGTPTHNDAYFSLFLKLGIKLGVDIEKRDDRRKFSSRKSSSNMRCPARF